MGRPQFTAPPEAFSHRKFLRNALLATPGGVSMTYIGMSLEGIAGAVVGFLLFAVLVGAAWHVDRTRTS